MLHNTLWEIIIAQTLRATSRYLSKILNGDEDASEYQENLCVCDQDKSSDPDCIVELLNQVESFQKEVNTDDLLNFHKAQQLQITDCLAEMLENNARFTFSPRSREQMRNLTHYLLSSLPDKEKIPALILLLVDRTSLVLLELVADHRITNCPLNFTSKSKYIEMFDEKQVDENSFQ
jgi:hypothetical protein